MALKARPAGPTVHPGSKGLHRWFTTLEHLMLLSGVVAVISLCYLLYLILSGQLSYTLVGGSQLITIVNSFELTTRVFLDAFWLLVLLALVRHYRLETLGLLIAGAGAICYFGMFYLINTHTSVMATQELQATAEKLIAAFRGNGAALIIVGMLRFIVGHIVMMTYHPPSSAHSRVPGVSYSGLTAPELRGSGSNSLMRKCWELHFCRGSVRTTCPRYTEGIACWSRKSGCYCDQDLAGRLLSQVTSAGGSSRMQMAEELETQQRRAQDMYGQAHKKRSKQASRKMCRECPIYNEHQKFKYKVLSWVMYPVAVLITALCASTIRTAYMRSDAWMASYLNQFSFIPRRLASDPTQSYYWFSPENIAIFIVGVLILALLLQAMEAAVFRLKL